MASSSSPPLIFFSLLFLSIFSLPPFFIHSINGEYFSVDLIHRDHSTKSPFFNSSFSSFDRLLAAVHRSISRSHHLFSLKHTVNSQIIPNNNDIEYLMTLQVGTPPFKILAMVDTGSDLTWAQCQPCKSCYRQKDPLFNPKSSSTYKTLPCKQIPCNQLPRSECTSTGGLCEYRYTYGDRSFTNGILSSDTFTFNNSEDAKNKQVSIPNILFGCSNYAYGTFNENEGGLVGLGGGQLSLVSQLGSSIAKKFSYCLLPYSESQNKTSLLKFGDKAVVERGPGVVTTPIVPGNHVTFYYLSLESIIVGKERVPVPSDLPSERGKGNIIIDSGTSLTMLDDLVLRTVIKKLVKVVKYRRVKVEGLDLCFRVGRGRIKLPELVFQFSGGAVVKLQVNNSFIWPTNRLACLAMTSSGKSGVPIYGNLAQQNFYIGYDLESKQLSFAPTDCSKLNY